MGWDDCEEDNCYCKEYPDGNWETLQVIDNDNDGEYTWRCETAIMNNDDIQKCSYCDRLMLGEYLEVYANLTVYEACVLCAGRVDMLKLLDLVYPTDCDRYRAFPDMTDDNPELVSELCDQCNQIHPKTSTENPLFEDVCTLVYTLNDNPDHKKEYFIQLHTSITEELEKKSRSESTLAKEAKEAKDKQAELYQRSRKRVLSTFIPIINDIPEDINIPNKFARFANNWERAELESLCDKPVLDLADARRVLAFIFGL